MSDETRNTENEQLNNIPEETAENKEIAHEEETNPTVNSDEESVAEVTDSDKKFFKTAKNLNSLFEEAPEAEAQTVTVDVQPTEEETAEPSGTVESAENDEPAHAIYVPDEVVAAKSENENPEVATLIYVPDSEIETAKTDAAPVEFKDGVAYTKNSDGNVTNCYEWNSTVSQKTPDAPEKPKKKSSNTGFKVFLTIMISIFTVATIVLIGWGINEFGPGFGKNPEQVPVNKNQNADNLETGENFDYGSVALNNPNYVSYDFKQHNPDEALSIPEIAAKCTPSSVGIVSESEYTTGNYFFGYSTGIAQASGSGFIYSSEGYIITNHHVIEDAKKITVYMHDGSEYEAEVVGSDSLSDIAVIKVEPKDGETFIPMETGNSNELVVGEPVVAIGCPAGIEFINTVTDGIVSSINRNVELTDDSGTVQKTMALIQTNATINHGNSGGPLINSRGQVIGINTLKLASDYEGIGFAIPMNGAISIVNQLIEYGNVVERTNDDFVYGKGIIGISGSDISASEAKFYKIPQGVLVIQIDKDCSAAKNGLKRGDIITHFNDTEVKTITELNKAKDSLRPGTEVSVTVYRDGDDNEGETLTIKFKLEEQE